MDEYGKDFAINVVQRVKNESERLKHQHGASSTQGPTPSASSSVVITPDKGRKIVFDNFDCKQHVHSMTEHHQNIDIHWVTHGSGKQSFREPLIQCETVTWKPTADRKWSLFTQSARAPSTERELHIVDWKSPYGVTLLGALKISGRQAHLTPVQPADGGKIRDCKRTKSLLACVHLSNCKIINIGSNSVII